MAHQNQLDREDNRGRSTSVSTAVDPTTPINDSNPVFTSPTPSESSVSRRRRSWNRSGELSPNRAPSISRPALSDFVPAASTVQSQAPLALRIPDDGSASGKDSFEQIRISPLPSYPNFSFNDLFQNDRSSGEFLQPIPGPSRMASQNLTVDTDAFLRPGASRSSGDSGDESDRSFEPDMKDAIPLGPLYRNTGQGDYEAQIGSDVANGKRPARRKTVSKPYRAEGLGRSASTRRLSQSASAIKRNPTLKGAAGLMRNISRRVAGTKLAGGPESDSESDSEGDEEFRPLTLPQDNDVQSEDESSAKESERRGDGTRAVPVINYNGSRWDSDSDKEKKEARPPSVRQDSEQEQKRKKSRSRHGQLGLQGKSLGIFAPDNPFRMWLFRALKKPYTETAVLLLIVFNAVVLVIQSAPALSEPRQDDGYFVSWEDTALFVIFIIYTFEAAARIIVSGFIFDPRKAFANPDGSTTVKGVSQPTVMAQRYRSVKAKFLQATSPIEPINKSPNTLRPSEAAKQQLRAQQQWRAENVAKQQQEAGLLHQPDGKRKVSDKLFQELPFEIAMKRQLQMAATGRPYLRHSWHRIDLLAIICFWITFGLALTGNEATERTHLYIFRALSTLRVARLLLLTSGTATVLRSLKRAGPLLLRVSFFLLFASLLFAIIGVQSFAGSFTRSCILSDPDAENGVIDLAQQCGGHLDPNTLEPVPWLLEDNSTASTAKGYICPLGQTCREVSSNPQNLGTFDNAWQSMLQVAIIASSNTYSGPMFQLLDSDYYSSGIFTAVALVLLNFWLVSLLIAVVVGTYSVIRAEERHSAPRRNETNQDPLLLLPEQRNRVTRYFAKSRYFWLLVILASIVTQAQKDANMPASRAALIDNLERVYTIILDVEIILRIAILGRRWSAFFEDGRSIFDLFLAIVTTVTMIPIIQQTEVGRWLTIFGLARWYRVILAIPPLRPLIAAQLLRGDVEAEAAQLSFDSIVSSYIACFQIMTSENWTTPLATAMEAGAQYRQEFIVALLLILWFAVSNWVLLNTFTATILEAFELTEEEKRLKQRENYARRNQPLPAFVGFFERWNPYRWQDPKPRSFTQLANGSEVALPLTNHSTTGRAEPTNPTKLLPWLDHLGRKGSLRLNANTAGHDEAEERALADILRRRPGVNVDIAAEAVSIRRKILTEFCLDHPGYDVSLFVFKNSSFLRRWCQKCFPPLYGARLFGATPEKRMKLPLQTILIAAVAASIAISARTNPLYRLDYYKIHGDGIKWFDIAEIVTGSVFFLEFGIKVVADGFLFTPCGYIRSLWNVMDLVVLLSVLVTTASTLIFGASISRFTRALTALRALRLITTSRHMRETFYNVIWRSAVYLLQAVSLLVLYLVPLAIYGVNLFSSRLYACNDTNVPGKSSCSGEYLAAPVDDSLVFLRPRIWTDPDPSGSEWTFNSFRNAILILYELVSLEGFTSVMASMMNITSIDQQPRMNESQYNAIYMVFYILIGSILIASLFLSVLISAFSERNGTALLTKAQGDYRALLRFLKQQNPPLRGPERTGLRAWCANRALNKRGWWNRAATLLYLAQMIILLLHNKQDTVISPQVANALYLGIALLLGVDIAIRLLGMGRVFFRNRWNIFDIVLVTGVVAMTVALLLDPLRWNESAIFQIQKIFLTAVCLKLVQRNDSLNQLFVCSIASAPALAKLLALWAVLFIFFDLAFLNVFGISKIGNNSFSRFTNWKSWGNGLYLLISFSTGEGFNAFMHDHMQEYPRCSTASNYLLEDCGSAAWAFALYISWNILSMYLLLNVFTACVVESFSLLWGSKESRVSRADLRRFKRVWSKFDPDRTGYIPTKKIAAFLVALQRPFDIATHTPRYSVYNLLKMIRTDPHRMETGIIHGKYHSIDVAMLEGILKTMNPQECRERRALWARIYHEARSIAVVRKGLSFQSALLLVARHKLVDVEQALELEDLADRRLDDEAVQVRIDVDRVRSLLKAVTYRRRFKEALEERRRMLIPEGRNIPAIVLQPINTSLRPPRETDITGSHSPTTPIAPIASPLWEKAGMSSDDDDEEDANKTFESVASIMAAASRRASDDSRSDNAATSSSGHARQTSDIGMAYQNMENVPSPARPPREPSPRTNTLRRYDSSSSNNGLL